MFNILTRIFLVQRAVHFPCFPSPIRVVGVNMNFHQMSLCIKCKPNNFSESSIGKAITFMGLWIHFLSIQSFCLLANSLKYPQRIEWSQSLNRLIVLCLIVSKFSNFYTVQYRRVQYSTVIIYRAVPVRVYL